MSIFLRLSQMWPADALTALVLTTKTIGWLQLDEQSGLITFNRVQQAREYNCMMEYYLESIYWLQMRSVCCKYLMHMDKNKYHSNTIILHSISEYFIDMHLYWRYIFIFTGLLGNIWVGRGTCLVICGSQCKVIGSTLIVLLLLFILIFYIQSCITLLGPCSYW